MAATTIEVQLFARLRELCGDRPTVRVELAGAATAADCFAALCRECTGLEPYRDRLAVAVNDEFAGWDRPLEDGDVVAFIPPVSGGGPGAPARRRRGR